MDQLVFEHVHLFLQFPFDLLSHVLEDYKPASDRVGRTLLSAAFDVEFPERPFIP